MKFSRLAFTFVLGFLINVVVADEWPQWRGANRDGKWNEKDVVETLPDKPKVKWRAPIGNGYTGPTVAGGKVYVMDKMTKPETRERVICFDAENGKEIWKHEYSCKYTIGYSAGPRASVTVHDGKAYAFGAMGQLTCLDAKTGKVVWEKDLNSTYKIQSRNRAEDRMPIWGMACSPLIHEDKLILQVGAKDAGIVAFNKNDGNEIWKATNDRGQYASPIMTKQGEEDVVICWTADSVTGVSPTDGKVFWSIPWKPRNMPIGCASPVLKDNRLFLTSFYDGAMLIELDQEKPAAKKLWHRIGDNERNTDALHSIISTPIWLGDHIYGVDSYGELRCLVAKTGDRVWENLTAVPKARWSTIHFIDRGEKTWMFNERGELLISRLSPKGFEELSRTKILEPTKKQLNQRGGVCWTHPAFAMKCVFARNDKELVCIDLSK